MSTISIGDGADDSLMSQLAQAGGGRFHRISQAAMATSLQDVMRREAESVRRAPIREGDRYDIAVVNSDGPLRSTSRMPSITGYGVVADRDRRAEVGARGPEGDPIVAYWNHGLGRVAAFTGDPFGPWAGDWPSWNARLDGAEDAFWRTMARWASRAPTDPGAKLAVVETPSGRSTHQIVLTLSDANGAPRSHGVATARLSLGGGAAGGTSSDIPLDPDGLGRFVAPLNLDRDAIGLVTVGFATSEGGNAPLTGRARAPIVYRGNNEWERAESDEALLRRAAQATGGVRHVIGSPSSVFLREGVHFPTWSHAVWQLFGLLAAMAFVLDVACRRLILPTRDRVLQAVAAPFVSTSEAAPSPAPPQPQSASPTSPPEPTTAASISRDLDQRLSRLQDAKRRASERRT